MHLPILADRRCYDDAAALIDAFGDKAGIEAALRADNSRTVGNHVNFCHWRQIERVLFVLQLEYSIGTVH